MGMGELGLKAMGGTFFSTGGKKWTKNKQCGILIKRVGRGKSRTWATIKCRGTKMRGNVVGW